MAKIKVTFTLDADTIGRLRQASERLAKPQSAVVREAIHDFSERVGRLSERERLRLLHLFDEVVPPIPARGTGPARDRRDPSGSTGRWARGRAPDAEVILLDASVLIDALTSPGRSAASLRRAIADGERILV